MPKNDSSFQDLEKQLAKDALEKALMDLHGEITKDIDKNKAAFSQEIQKTLNNFKTDLEKTISKELDQRISAHWKKHFLDISSKVISSFDESSSPFLKRAEEDLQRLHMQGEKTLHSWEAMMKQFRSLWNKPFIVALLACILTGAVTSVFSSYLLVRDDRRARGSCESDLSWIAKEYFQMKEALEAKTSKEKDINKATTKASVKTKKK
ncbi:MAG: hypothetical protein A2W46_00090 [Alphaproteobacteria bacterium RIFCSPHIGHO2_12_42_13]|nr:MAG: hypothetical protein A2Z80_02105 [Alphaproteobacteria bacterium GWA2_41_27]OFW84682.1 MAG: hypothetical protein A3E50_05865 [Alphaproteobacteria bacterium RIFCSPHIGHO2_12_FULL_42_100]OFW86307.1 MAG: hypothetical protein A2W06_04850 [Alphaproteobacteria bacterium RBG_16_42_14]OFW91500.1 MAG: hypothetical protein A2W46_00090 [Alphaproteobacteria bacterium RIFCSPHIGHO2_12_42_13]OFW92794.1 MAG: hypothetical protein A3C41_05665 [Alphaproteobacteria bacterium RIFCSPHIGHO2_02_FULL_42_30]OFX06